MLYIIIPCDDGEYKVNCSYKACNEKERDDILSCLKAEKWRMVQVLEFINDDSYVQKDKCIEF